jgi:hypothetical protein
VQLIKLIKQIQVVVWQSSLHILYLVGDRSSASISLLIKIKKISRRELYPLQNETLLSENQIQIMSFNKRKHSTTALRNSPTIQLLELVSISKVASWALQVVGNQLG